LLTGALAADLAVNGLVTGLFYGLMAIGLALIFGVLRIVNFAHGEFYMVGAYAYTIVAARLGVPLVVALPIAFLFGAALGWVVERTLMRPLYANIGSWGLMRDEYAVIVTFGLSLLLVNLVDKAIGPYAFRAPALVDASRIVVGPALMSGQKVAAAGVTLAVLALIALFLRFSYWGRAVRAVSQNRLGASLAGIDATTVSSLVFALAGGLAALAGALLSPIINASPDVGAFPAIKSYVIVVLGGMGSIPGAFIASLLLGLVESFGAVLISYQYRDTFGLVLLILFLLFRPQGLFGERGREV
jgi:branched-chain amino acid transport system permease protein